jgi:hypothetical protein
VEATVHNERLDFVGNIGYTYRRVGQRDDDDERRREKCGALMRVP